MIKTCNPLENPEIETLVVLSDFFGCYKIDTETIRKVITNYKCK